MEIQTKKCTKCLREIPRADFPERIVNGRRYPRTYCRPCFNKSTNDQITPARRATRQRVYEKRLERQREGLAARDPVIIAKTMLNDSRGNDRKKGRDNDLTREFIIENIQKPCTYCGIDHSQARMTLDRVDNTLGHLQSNVVPACTRCNMFRGSMPYEAFLLMRDGLRQAVQSGLLDDWYGGPANHRRGR